MNGYIVEKQAPQPVDLKRPTIQRSTTRRMGLIIENGRGGPSAFQTSPNFPWRTLARCMKA